MRRVTIKDIAREVGVSPQTVSRAMNDKGEIRPQTRERILKVAGKLGYRPNSVARSLATRRTQNVGLVVPDVSNPFFAGIARGIQDIAHLAGYNIFLCNTDEDTKREMSAIHSLEAQRVDGMILCSPRLGDQDLVELAERYQPLVLVNRHVDHPRTGCILVDDATGAEEAVQYLVKLGHRHIGLIAGPELSHSGQERSRGYRHALERHHIAGSPSWETHCAPQVEGGELATKQLLRQAPELTVLLAYNDLVAVGAMRACVGLGLRVPADCAIVGFDDIPLAALVSPALTTVHIPKYNLGREAMNLMLGMIRQEVVSYAPIVLAPHLVIRDSVDRPCGQGLPAQRSIR